MASNFRWCCRKTANGMVFLELRGRLGRGAVGAVPLDTPRYASYIEGRGLPSTGPNRSVPRIVRENNRKRDRPTSPNAPTACPRSSTEAAGTEQDRKTPWLESPRSRRPPRPPRPPRPRSGPRRPRSRPPPRPAKAKAAPAAEGDAPAPAGSRGRSLVIVESPKKAKSINKFLGSGFVVKASMGHVRDLPKRKLGLDVIRGYAPSYEIMAAKKDTIAELKREAAKADMVYLATDPDREGEAIAWHLQEALDLPDERVRRVLFYEITEKAVKEAFNHVGPIDMDKVNAQQARRFLDRFVGYELSPPALEEGRPAPQRRPGPVGRRPPDRRAREGDPGVRLRGILADHRHARPRPARPRRPTGSRPSWPTWKGEKFAGQGRGRRPGHPRRPGRRPLQGRRGRGGREARQARRPVQDQHPPAAGRDPAPVLRQADHEGRPGALRRDRRRRRRPDRPHHLHEDRQPPRSPTTSSTRVRDQIQAEYGDRYLPAKPNRTPPASRPRRPTRRSGRPTWRSTPRRSRAGSRSTSTSSTR